MIRFPYLDYVKINDEEKIDLLNASIDIFINFTLKNIPQNFVEPPLIVSEAQKITTLHEEQPQIKKLSDIHEYTVSPKQIKEDITERITQETIYDWIGFQINSQNEVSLKNKIIRMIQGCSLIVNQKEYIQAVKEVQDSDIEVLRQFETQVQKLVDEQNFNETVDIILNAIGGLLDIYCTGEYEVKLGEATFNLPPIYGIQEDIKNMIHSREIQTKIMTSVQGVKLVQLTSSPFFKMFISMGIRIFNNYRQLNEKKKRKEQLQKIEVSSSQ